MIMSRMGFGKIDRKSIIPRKERIVSRQNIVIILSSIWFSEAVINMQSAKYNEIHELVYYHGERMFHYIVICVPDLLRSSREPYIIFGSIHSRRSWFASFSVLVGFWFRLVPACLRTKEGTFCFKTIMLQSILIFKANRRYHPRRLVLSLCSFFATHVFHFKRIHTHMYSTFHAKARVILLS